MLWPGQMQLLLRKQTLLIQIKETVVGLPGLQGGTQAGGSCLDACMAASLRCMCMSEECNVKLHHSSAHALLEHVRSCKHMEAKSQCQEKLLMCSCLSMLLQADAKRQPCAAQARLLR